MRTLALSLIALFAAPSLVLAHGHLKDLHEQHRHNKVMKHAPAQCCREQSGHHQMLHHHKK
ncbi:MAG TPA: hypothetical protein VGI40_13775 [Pirellulaceae bacterium]